MTGVLVDSSVWIEYFRGHNVKESFENLLDNSQIYVNDLILSELIPYLIVRKENKVIDLLRRINKFEMHINWQEIISFQVKNIKNGINKIGIPDLLIMQNALQNDLSLFTLDVHFRHLQNIHGFKLY
ncbi:MAG: PIN domain-containing protein [Candidatus Latescibacteria bacterium]|nr:PIN domain-containing protein [Candidatus Latescibacterota bacterium]